METPRETTKNDNRGEFSPNSLLSKYFVQFVSFTLLEFSVLQYFLFTYGGKVCTAEYVREPWARDVNLLVCGAFILKVVLQTFRILSGVCNSERNIRSTFYSALTVNFIAAVSTLTTLYNSQGTCIDGNG